MKTTWRRKRNNLPIPGPALIFILVFLIGWGVVAATKNLMPGTVERFVETTTNVEDVAAGSSAAVFSFFTDKASLEAQVRRLEDNEVALELQIQSLLYLQEENEALREVARRDTGVLGSVIAWPPKTAYDTLIVKVSEAVSVGDLVLGQGVIPLGTVSRIEGNFAYVELLTHGGKVTSVRAGEERLPLELLGRGGGSAVIVAPSETPIDRGDEVFFPYDGNAFLGRIGAVESDSAASTKRLWVSFPRHFFSYTWVSIVPYIDV